MEIQTLPKTLHRLVEGLTEAVKQRPKMTPAIAQEVVMAANVAEEDIREFADFDHDVADSYGRKLVYEHPEFEVMVMSWNPGHYSSIHNHGYTQWGAVQAFGHVHHQIYHVKADVLAFSKKEILPKGTIAKVNHQLVHQMGNATTEKYLTLHVYGAPKDSYQNCVTADARNYDLEFDRISYTTGGAFFNLPTEEIYDISPGPKATPDVMLHYMSQLLAYYHRQPQSRQIDCLKEQLLQRLEDLS